MKKKIGAILAASAMACTMTAGIALSGCGVAKLTDFDMPEGGYDGREVTITFANTMGGDKPQVLADAIADFNVMYPNIHVVVDNTIKSYDTLFKNINNKLTTNSQPNIAFCYSDHVAEYNIAGGVLPINGFLYDGAYKDMKVAQVKVGADGKGVRDENGDLVYEQVPLGFTKEQQEDYVEAFFAEGSVYGDGKTYTLPFAKSTEVMYYNKDFMDTHGFTEKYDFDNLTWDDVEKLCEDILGKIGDDLTKYPLGYDSDANLFITMCEQNGAPYTSAEGDDHFLFNSAKNEKFVKRLVDWRDKGYLITQSTNNDTYTSYKFTAEECYMSIGSTGGSSYQDPGEIDGEAKFTVGVARVPQIDTKNPKSILQGPSVCIFKNDDPYQVLASWLLVKYLTTNAFFQCRYSEGSGYMPVTKSAYANELYQQFLTKDNLMARTAKTCKEMVDDNAFYLSDAFFGSSYARGRVEILMKSVLTGGNIKDALDKAVKACNDYIS